MSAEASLGSFRYAILSDPACLDGFSCGERSIDRRISNCCEQHSIYKSRLICIFTARDPKAIGFYCLSAHGLQSNAFDQSEKEKKDWAGLVPFIYINYLAVRKDVQNRRVGSSLLVNALKRCAIFADNVGLFGVALNALNDRVAVFYQKRGFSQRGDASSPFMILPTQTLLDMFGPNPGS